jgi:hypothetical protein
LEEIKKYLRKKMNKAINDGNLSLAKSINNALEALDDNYTTYPVCYIPNTNTEYILQ